MPKNTDCLSVIKLEDIRLSTVFCSSICNVGPGEGEPWWSHFGIEKGAGGCVVPNLPAFVDCVALDMEIHPANRLNLDRDRMDCGFWGPWEQFQQLVTAAGGVLTPVSAYRPLEYQNHFVELWNNHITLEALDEVGQLPDECKNLYKVIKADIKAHSIQGPSATSNHPSGKAIDLNYNGITSAKLFELAEQAGFKKHHLHEGTTSYHFDLDKNLWQGQPPIGTPCP